MLPQSVQADVAGVLIWHRCVALTPCLHQSPFVELGKHPQAFWAALDTSPVKAARSGQRLTELTSGFLRTCTAQEGPA